MSSGGIDRGQVGLGTVAVFIAMALVAALAAGAVVNTAGVLETRAETTSEESIDRTSDRLRVVTVTGNVTEYGTVDVFNFTVMKAPGSGPIDLENVTYTVVDSETVATETVGNGSGLDSAAVETVTAETENVQITDQGDRYIISIPAATRATELRPRETLSIRFTTAADASTTEVVTAPKTLGAKSKAHLDVLVP